MGWSAPNEEARADHYRDHAKHDDAFPIRLETGSIPGALEVAILAQTVSIPKPAELIECYARAQAAAARLDAVTTTIDRCCEAIEAEGSISRDLAEDFRKHEVA